jgi:ParB/RepB/Spo0J family partition protein
VASSGSSPSLLLVPLELIEADTTQPREDFPRPELEALADSIEALGLLHPLVVEKVDDRYRLIAGERRLRALRIGRETGRRHDHFVAPPVLVRADRVPDPTRRLLQLAENLARADLRPVEVARGLQGARQALELERLLEAVAQIGRDDETSRRDPEELRRDLTRSLQRAGVSVPRITWEDVLHRVGMRMDPARRKAYLRLLRLPDDVLDDIDRAGLSVHAADAVSRLGDASGQRELLRAAAERRAPRAVAQAAAAMISHPELPADEAVEGILQTHREADVSRSRSAPPRVEAELDEEAVRSFARAAKTLVRELDRARPNRFQAETIRLLCSEVAGALPARRQP